MTISTAGTDNPLSSPQVRFERRVKLRLTATRSRQTVWLDDPDSGPQWDLPADH